jgi:hypothetical protein
MAKRRRRRTCMLLLFWLQIAGGGENLLLQTPKSQRGGMKYPDRERKNKKKRKLENRNGGRRRRRKKRRGKVVCVCLPSPFSSSTWVHTIVPPILSPTSFSMGKTQSGGAALAQHSRGCCLELEAAALELRPLAEKWRTIPTLFFSVLSRKF